MTMINNSMMISKDNKKKTKMIKKNINKFHFPKNKNFKIKKNKKVPNINNRKTKMINDFVSFYRIILLFLFWIFNNITLLNY